MIYVDELVDYNGMTKLKYDRWCHLWTDGDIDELHKFAQSIGLKRRWFQDKMFSHGLADKTWVRGGKTHAPTQSILRNMACKATVSDNIK